MPNPGGAPPRLPIEDSYLELLADTLDGLDVSARGQFLQRYIRAITHLDLRESQCIQLWDEMLTRRRELTDHLGRQVALKTALMDVLTSAGLFRVPIILEYDELKVLQVNAVTDPLTGLYNRRLFSEGFEKELNRARRYGLPLGLVMLDLHRFKEVNDKHGHPAGDEVLRAAAATLKKALRTSDSAFRIGGDEFAVLLPQTDAEQALALSRRIETVFAETLQSLPLSVNVNMDHGVATFPQDGEQADQLIRVADERLYRLKHANHRKLGNGGTKPVAAATPALEPTATTAPAAPPEPAAAPAPPTERNGITTKPISIESRRTPEKPESTMAAAASASAAEISSSQPTPPQHVYAMQRKAERVSMTGTNAYAMLGDQNTRRARVIDLGFGGVAIELDKPENLPDSILAILHVPILPPVRVSLKPVWKQQTKQGAYRIGCAFVS
ncbi:MAG TPA: diguanylate cyclase [Bryobacteraceae bacterium]|jgi:diguanylate cyclase (GGDEF)-like protein|nr:diguanylate cyclase [Bryobacteraceae bacterium]